MEYTVTITEILKKKITVDADSKEEALSKVEDKYTSGKIVLDSDDFVDFEMEVEEDA